MSCSAVSFFGSRLAFGMVAATMMTGVAEATDVVPHRNDAHCAAYGPGFAAVAGSDTCIRIGGRVRVEAGNGKFLPDTGWANNAVVPATTSDTPAQRRRLRLDDTNTAPIDPFAH